MFDQAQLNQRSEKPAVELSGSLSSDVGGFAHDVLMLAELQSQLFLAEIQEVKRRSILPSALLMAGFMLGASCCPFALIAFALSLAQWASLSMATAFVIVLAVGALTSLVLLIASSLLLRKRMHFFRRSQEEFSRNYEWFRSAFKSNRIPQRNLPN